MLVQLFVLQEYYSVAFVAGMLFAKLEVNSEKFKKILSKWSLLYSTLSILLKFGSIVTCWSLNKLSIFRFTKFDVS